MMGALGILLQLHRDRSYLRIESVNIFVDALQDGLDLAPLAMGLFGISEILSNIEETVDTEILKTKIKNLFPTWADWTRAKWAILRGTLLGSS
jgi:putative tricarboxylic transport membrane protein